MNLKAFSRSKATIRAHPWRALALTAIAGFALLNALAFMHAWSMTHFVKIGGRTADNDSQLEEMHLADKARAVVFGVRINRPENYRTPSDLDLVFDTCRFDAGDGNECEAWFVPQKNPKGLVLLFHGFASCKTNLLAESQVFHELGYATLLVDFRGSGGSDGHTTTIGFREANDVRAAVDFAAEELGYSAPVLYGQSMGSAAILRAIAVHGVRPRGIVIECPFDRLISTVENRFSAMGLPSFPAAELLVFWGGVQQGYSGFSHNPADYAKSVNCPTLLLHGANDARVTPVQVRQVFDNLDGPKQLVLFDELGHGAGLLADPERWTSVIATYLGELPIGDIRVRNSAPEQN
ncbi:MAG TPA: alpha/beta fold hydrolase [Pirellulales bacterium]|jgi:hypothetical protein